jgi:DnaJ family protein A protein 5
MKSVRNTTTRSRYDASDAPRQVLMTRVQQLVMFIQHRDPRYKAHQLHLAREKAAAAKAKIAAARAPKPKPTAKDFHFQSDAARALEAEHLRAASNFKLQDWQRPAEPHLDEVEDGAGLRVKVEEGEGDEVFECVACNKTFGSERSWENHERSKRHKQAVWK